MGIKISNLPSIVTPAMADVFPVVQGGVTYKESLTQLSSLFATAGANTNITSLAGLTTPLSIPQGGTGVTAATITPTPTAFAGWNTNSNLLANNFLGGFETYVSAAGTTTLTVASAGTIEITGSTTQTIVMPVVSTLRIGTPFKIINNSSGVVTVNSSGGNLILTMAANTTAFLSCVLIVGTSAASWNSSYVFDLGAGVLSITGTANQILASSSTGDVTLSLPQDIATTSAVQFNTVRLNASNLLDSNGAVAASFPAASSAVNYLSVVNSGAASPVQLSATGSDTNIPLTISYKGTSQLNILGRNNGVSVSAGYVGEIIASHIPFASAISYATVSTAQNLTSITLSAGLWQVSGNIYFHANGNNLNYAQATLSLVSNTNPDQSNFSLSSVVAANNHASPTPIEFYNVSSPTTIYLVATAGFGGSGTTICGNLVAIRQV